LRHAVLPRRITGGPLHWAERSLAGDAALKLPLHFLRAALFKRISAATRSQPCDHEQDRQALHLLILGSERCIAIADCGTEPSDSLKS
jgi:hypothetical protein